MYKKKSLSDAFNVGEKMEHSLPPTGLALEDSLLLLFAHIYAFTLSLFEYRTVTHSLIH